MFVSAYLNARISTNFSVSLPFSPNTLSCSFPMYPSQHCQSKSQPFVSMGEMTAKQPRITNKYLMQYHLLLPPRWLHYLTRYARDVSWGKKRANVNNLPSWHSRGPNKTWLTALKEWKTKSPSSKIHLCAIFYHIKGSSGMENEEHLHLPIKEALYWVQ